jgi:hypothetical protein
VKDAPSSLEAVREQVRYAHDDVVRLLSSGPTTNERISAAERIRSALAALATLEESVRKDALKAAEARIRRRCCDQMNEHGHCAHQPCDYYQNALGEVRDEMRRK